MSVPNSDQDKPAVTTQPLFMSNYGLVTTVYVLYLLGFVTAVTAVVGVIIATLQVEKADELCRTHFRFQMRTFWIGLLYVFVGVLTFVIGIGAVILLWWMVWTLIRCVKGLLALNAGEPIRDPNTWWFGS